MKEAHEEEKKPDKIYCDICKKSFSSKNAFDQHERSKRHIKGLKKFEEDFQNAPEEPVAPAVIVDDTKPEEKDDSEEKSEFEPEEYEFDPKRCLFCGAIHESMEESLFCICFSFRCLAHMAKKHVFIIPDRDSLIDLEGLLDYLGQKISVGCVCIGCNHGFKSPFAVRAHMLDKGHTRIAYETVGTMANAHVGRRL